MNTGDRDKLLNLRERLTDVLREIPGYSGDSTLRVSYDLCSDWPFTELEIEFRATVNLPPASDRSEIQ